MNENIEQAEKPVFVKDRSIFAPWIEDNSRSINKCFEYDKQRWKLSRFMKSEIEIKTVESFLKQNYGLLKDLFDTAQSTMRFPQVGNGEILEMCDKLGISGPADDQIKNE